MSDLSGARPPGRGPGYDVVVVDHHDSYTWNLVHLIAAVTGVLPSVVQHDRVSAADVLSHDFVVLSPGPGSPHDPADFGVGSDVLRAGTRPVLGVCLGLQGMVATWGGRVDRIDPAHGRLSRITHDDTGLFAGVPQEFEVVRYHSLAALEVPQDLRVTARAEDGVVMGVQHRHLRQHGVQFHPESILSTHGADLVRNFLEDA